MGLGGVAIAVPPYVIYPKTAVLGRAGGGQVSQVQKLKKLSLTEELRQMQHLTRFCISN